MADGPMLRYCYGATLRRRDGTSFWFHDIIVVPGPIEPTDVVPRLVSTARQKGYDAGDDSIGEVNELIQLGAVPRPPASDTRSLLYWTVRTYFTCADIKVAGDATGVFAWPDQPAGADLDHMVWLLADDKLTWWGHGPGGNLRSDIVSVEVAPSSEAPTIYA